MSVTRFWHYTSSHMWILLFCCKRRVSVHSLAGLLVCFHMSLCWRFGHRVQADGRLDDGRHFFKKGSPTLLLPHCFHFSSLQPLHFTSLSFMHCTYFSSASCLWVVAKPPGCPAFISSQRLKRDLWNHRAMLIFPRADACDFLWGFFMLW